MKNWSFIIYGVLLCLTIYLKYINQGTSNMLKEYPQLHPLLVFLIFYISVNFTAHFLKYSYSKRNKIPKGKKNNVHFGIENIASVVIGIGVLSTFLSVFGINPTEVITSMTIVAAAIAILTKEYIQDFISGIYLSFSNTFEINDYVRIDNKKGKVIEINMLKVKIMNDDDDVVILPNSKVHLNDIVNYTKRDVRLMYFDFQIGLKYITSIEQLEKEIATSLENLSDQIEPGSYNLKVVEMKMDFLEVKFQYKLKKADMELQKIIRKKAIREVINLMANKQEMPTPKTS